MVEIKISRFNFLGNIGFTCFNFYKQHLCHYSTIIKLSLTIKLGVFIMGYETSRSLISVTETDTQKQTNTNIEYNTVSCNGFQIKLPKDKSLYSSDHFIGVLHDLFVEGQTENVRYYDDDFHSDMKLISELNPNILFGINVLVSQYNESTNEYYLNEKMLVDEGCWAYKYDNEQDVLGSEDWQDIVTQ